MAKGHLLNINLGTGIGVRFFSLARLAGLERLISDGAFRCHVEAMTETGAVIAAASSVSAFSGGTGLVSRALGPIPVNPVCVSSKGSSAGEMPSLIPLNVKLDLCCRYGLADIVNLDQIIDLLAAPHSRCVSTPNWLRKKVVGFRLMSACGSLD
ncbi:MAG: hypothetical protein IPP45_10770 [Sphingomonadales bacterium]|nr:hypothetical protein [Sphingomonadales bacterium]